MAERDFKGVWIPKEVWLDDRLNALEKVILVEIDSLDTSDEHCWKSNENLAAFCQCSTTKVSNAISKLIKLGYVKVHSFDGRTRKLQSCLTVSVEQPYKNCKADSQNLYASNTKSNTKSISDEEETACVCACEDNPFGDGDSRPPVLTTVQKYATDNLRSMSPGNIEEFNDFLDQHGVSDDVMRYAIDVACGNGSPVWNYVAQTLYGWLEEGVKTVADAKVAREKHSRSRAAPSNSPPKNPFGIDRRNNKTPKPMGRGQVL